MGRIEAYIPDALETEFRIEITKRFGGKKGDLQKSIIQAIKIWIKSNIIEQLKRKAMGNASVTEVKAIVDTLVVQGTDALYALGEILNSTQSVTEVTYITKAIRQLSPKKSLQGD